MQIYLHDVLLSSWSVRAAQESHRLRSGNLRQSEDESPTGLASVSGALLLAFGCFHEIPVRCVVRPFLSSVRVLGRSWISRRAEELRVGGESSAKIRQFASSVTRCQSEILPHRGQHPLRRRRTPRKLLEKVHGSVCAMDAGRAEPEVLAPRGRREEATGSVSTLRQSAAGSPHARLSSNQRPGSLVRDRRGVP